ncbi:MAG: hypothetical protein F7C34_04030 [Desulfurococcales archaeon]|nr:hypothetical protein [Desulfurococcales archaeon]
MPKRQAKKAGKRRGASRRSRSASGSRSRKWKLDMDKVVGEVGREVIERLGLDYLGIDIDFIRDILEEIIAGIAESRSTKPSIESLVKNIVRNKDLFYKAIAAKLATKENLTVEQLEFIVSYAPEVAGRAAPQLFRIARELGADHIISALRFLWSKYGRPTPFTCPRCGFRALTPDLKCLVCGAEVSEEEFKRSIGFESLLEDLARSSPASAMEILSAGLALYDGERLYPPSSRALLSGRPIIEIYLGSHERKILESILRQRVRG